MVNYAGFDCGAIVRVLHQRRKIPAVHSVVTLPPLSWSALSLPMLRYLLVLMLFVFPQASETFIVLLSHQLGIGIVAILLLIG